MVEEISIRVSPEVASDMTQLRHVISSHVGIESDDINDIAIIRRSIDSRQRKITVNLTVRYARGEDHTIISSHSPYKFEHVSDDAPEVIIVGAGPAGLFAALELIKHNIRPVVLERGKDVDARRMDIAALNRTGIADPDSNYCFGEGGAGTFSDGKLHTRSKKKGDNDQIMRLLVDHGASPEILIDSHPHIGSNRLPGIIKSIRQTILKCGGIVKFNTRVNNLIIKDNIVKGVVTSTGEEIKGEAVILAIGHSARDTIRNIHAQGVDMETKGFALGVRLEHPSQLIDKIQYHNPHGRGKYLPAAEYNFVTQSASRGVYSFCMCPGGVVVPAVSAPGESVVNGMSASARSGRWSNSGMVVEIRPDDFPEYDKYGVFKLLKVQEDLEKRFYEAAGNTLRAPAQRMTDFVNGKMSTTLPSSSYVPGLKSARVDTLLPPFISDRLKDGFRQFDKKAKGFLNHDATVIGLESRTSSPVRIPRDRETLRHLNISGLYPAGEGAGYAGGIISAAVDGTRCASAIATNLNK
ncbi:MAG: NAD(P)/FAD-dependent oxidoreductase [Muribaculaceae bacterium]|nr:NAD(P)/FAD-dependent oxidoreductase [Muribaculaceae bacterium]